MQQVRSPKPEFRNAAWVCIPTGLDKKSLSRFCVDVERLFRLNPYLRIFSWNIQHDTIDACWENHSLEHPKHLYAHMNVVNKPGEVCIRYQGGIKSETYFIFQQNGAVADLFILDRYKDDANEETHAVDKSIHAWGEALNRFFKHYKYLNKIPGVDSIIDRFWIKLSPMARRVTYMLLIITAVEVIALLLFVLLMLLK